MSARLPSGVDVHPPIWSDGPTATQYSVEVTRDGERVCVGYAATKLGATRKAMAEARRLGWCPTSNPAARGGA